MATNKKPIKEKPTRKKRVVEEKPVRKKRTVKEPTRKKRVVEEKSTRKKKDVKEKPVRKKRLSVDVDKQLTLFNPLSNLDDELDNIEKSYALTGSSMLPGEKRQTTGLLCLDLVLSGGIIPGWYTTFGPEQSCKSTLTMWMMLACIDSKIPVKVIWDYEGSLSPEYVETMMRSFGLDLTTEQVFGVRNPKTQQWEVKPLVRPYSENIGEKFFDYLARLERILPDKKYIGDQWYYIYENTKLNKSKVGSHYDEKYFRKTGMLRVPAPDGKLQALVLVDSYPAMLPEKQDVDDPNSAIAVQARMFSEQLKRVKGRLRSKRIAVLGVNQLRDVPMAMFGPKESEPCGTALRFFSDVRLRATPRALSGVPVNGFKGKGMMMEEGSVNYDGSDTYRFIHIKATKNKLSVPYFETWVRLWINDAKGKARGFDIVWDTFYYLKQTGQLKGDGKKMTIELVKGPVIDRPLTWKGFKILIVGSKASQKEAFAKIGIKPFSLRDFCKKQLSSGKGMDLYMEHKHKASKEVEETEDGSDDDD
jgi:RecA/RadA recombinase